MKKILHPIKFDMILLVVACIPTYNEEKTIGKIVRKALSHVDKVIICDDGSTDNTAKEAQSSGAYVLKHNRNKGKGAALKTLFQHALQKDADIIVTIDGDGQFLPDEIPKLVTPIVDGTSDIVIGNRFSNNAEIPKYRKFGNKVLTKVTNIATESTISDTQGGFRAYSKEAINTIHFSTNGFGADAEIIIDASKKGLRIKERNVKVIYNTNGKTSTLNPPALFTNILTPILEIVIIKHPFKFLGIPGLILMIIGITFLTMMITIFNDDRYFSIPITLIAFGGIFTGLLSIFMAMLLYAINTSRKRSSNN